MAETSKNKIYYNDNENSVADVLADMKKMAESTDKAIENSKYDDTQIKKDISYAKKEQALKDAEQDNKIIELQNEKAELEKELKEAQEDFYQNSIRGQANGEYIHVEDSSNCRARIGISGNSEQETRSGKNLSKIEKISTINGGYINSTCGILATIEAGKTYTISFNCSNKHSGTNAIYVRVLNENTYEGQAALNYSSGNRISKTFVASKSGELSLSASLGTDFEDILYDIQLEEGSTATKYEQYGASPSPDYLSKIETVGSNVNIFDKDNMTIGKIWGGATLLDSDVGNASPKIPVTAGKTYIRNAGYSSNYIIKENNSVVDVQGGTNAITMPEDAKYWIFNIPKDIDINTIKAEEGSISTPYSKFGQGCVKVTKCNKNIFKPEEFSIINQNVTCSYKDGKFTLNGEVTSAFTIDISKHFDFNKIAQLTVNKNVTFSIQKYTGNIDFELNLGSRSSFYILQLRSLKKTKITKNLLEELTRFSLYVGVGKYNNFSFELQLEIGDNQTVSVGPAEQSYIMPTQTEMLENDYLDYDNEEEVHVWGKKIFDGTELWNKSGNKYPTFYFSPCDISSKFAVPENAKGLCNYFKQIGSIWEQDVMAFDIANITTTHSDFRFCLGSNSTITTLEEWKNKLSEMYNSGQPLVLYFQLRTPIRLKFTDEQKAVAKELNNARTYKNVTNITTDSKAILSLDYAKDLETLLNNTQALAVNNASEGV